MLGASEGSSHTQVFYVFCQYLDLCGIRIALVGIRGCNRGLRGVISGIRDSSQHATAGATADHRDEGGQ